MGSKLYWHSVSLWFSSEAVGEITQQRRDGSLQKKPQVSFGACSPAVEHLACTEESRVQFPAGPFKQFRGVKVLDKQAKLGDKILTVIHKSYST